MQLATAPAPTERLQVSIKHAAELLDYSTRTIYRLIAAGELVTTGSGQLLRIDYQSLLDYRARISNAKEAA